MKFNSLFRHKTGDRFWVLFDFMKRKAFAYITQGDRLLVFRHLDFPEAGIQVPGGTVKEDESPAEAARREAEEESGLSGLVVAAYLGEQVRDMRDYGLAETHHRFFYHLLCAGGAPERWQHNETDPSDGSPEPIRLEFFWAALPDAVPPLIGGQARFLSVLLERNPYA